jgi:hypothetical protein
LVMQFNSDFLGDRGQLAHLRSAESTPPRLFR